MACKRRPSALWPCGVENAGAGEFCSCAYRKSAYCVEAVAVPPVRATTTKPRPTTRPSLLAEFMISSFAVALRGEGSRAALSDDLGPAERQADPLTPCSTRR